MKTGKAALAVLFIVLAAMLWVAPVFADTSVPRDLSPAEHAELAQKAEKAFQSAAKSLKIQTDMPGDNPFSLDGMDSTKNQYNNAPEKQRKERKPWNFTPGMAKVVLIIVIAIIVIIILVTLRNNLWSDSKSRKIVKKKENGGDETGSEATSLRMSQAQSEADELAAQGLYAEAMHVLLLQSVSELRLRLSVSIAVSLTSREILQRIGLAPQGHADFADIISRVEISYFGYHQPSANDYTACRNSYDSLTDILRKGGATA